MDVHRLVQQSLKDKDAIDRALLASDPDAMAREIVELRTSERYMLWALAILGFFVWLALISRGPRY